MKKMFFTLLITAGAMISFAQEITLSFTAKDASTQNTIDLDSVLIENVTLTCDTVIPGPNPSLVIQPNLGLNENYPAGRNFFRITAKVPNPFSDHAIVSVYMPSAGNLMLMLSNTAGNVLAKYSIKLEAGLHNFEITSVYSGLLVLNAYNDREVVSAKLINNSSGAGTNKIRYAGLVAGITKDQLKNSTSENNSPFRFNLGDTLKYTAMATAYHDGMIIDSPVAVSNYEFQMTEIATLPTVLTSIVTDTTSTTAISGGNVTDDGSDPVTAKGVCWSTSPEPTLADNYTNDGSGTGEYTSYLTGLTPFTPFYVRAYATNSVGTAYGDELLFTTLAPDALFKLVGEALKTWKLIRDVSTGRYPIQIFQYYPYDPQNPIVSWWAMGLGNDEMAYRPCMLNDEWILYRDGLMLEYKTNGDYWAEGGVFSPDNICASTDDPMLAQDGADLSAWGGGIHAFELGEGKLKAIGHGAFIGFLKLATDFEVSDIPGWIPDEVDYDIVKLTDGTTDTLIIQGHYYDNPQSTDYYLGTWRFVLVHYDNPNDEPPIPTPMPQAGFSYILDGYTVAFTNTSTFAESYLWDFGDGATSTETNPVHTYSGDGTYNVSLTATNINGDDIFSQTIIISSSPLTEDILVTGPWKLQVTGHACYVGPGLGSDAWWICPLVNLDGTMVGTADDWSCMTDDEFIFSAGGGYEYKTNGGSRNDGYMGAPNGCWTDAEIAASPGAPFGSCNTHTFTFTPAAGNSRAIIELTNGPGYAAFTGFMKGYYGGENNNGSNPPNGGNPTNRYEVIAYANNGEKEILIISVDITADHSGTAAWTMELERPVSAIPLTEEILTAGAWRLQVSDHACYVGPGMGSDGWWITPLANLDGTMIGTPDDWSCMTDDDFIFSAGGGYEYKTNGGSRNDGYMGTPNGCWTDAEIAASPGAPFGSCNTHTFTFTPATETSRAIIELTNGPGYAAFIGFMKSYYGGENNNGAYPPNGGNQTNRYEVMAYANNGEKEILIVTVDITADHSGTAAWTMELER